MCRWLAYSGPPVFLDSVLFKPENSLIRQSLRALEGRHVTNGDGFGVGWYGERQQPGLFRDTLPAWNDENLHSIAEQIKCGLFLAHVRASTASSTARVNCHPFRHENWLFMHNGEIGGFSMIRRSLSIQIAPELYANIQGATDSEIFFYLLLSNGIGSDPVAALRRTISIVLRARSDHGIDDPFSLAAAFSDGRTVYAIRYADSDDQPSLYYGFGMKMDETHVDPEADREKGIFILSEPLDFNSERWAAVPPSHMVVAGDGAVALLPFTVE